MKTARIVAVWVWVGLAFVAAPYGAAEEPGSIVGWGNSVVGVDLSHGFVAVSAGGSHNLALKADGSIVAWGTNSRGQCEVPGPNTGFVGVAAGHEHSVGLKADGSIVVWGDTSRPPEPNTGFVAVSAGLYHNLGLKADGSIVAWGANDAGQCNVPEPNTGFVAVEAGWLHSRALKADGSTVAWGWNDYGQTATPGYYNTKFVAVSAGYNHDLALKPDGSIIGWGSREYGQLRVPSPNTGFVAVSAGMWFSLGLKGNGSLVTWGSNEYGQCVLPTPNTGFVAVSAGSLTGVGLKADGSVVSWGRRTCQYNVPGPNSGFVAVSTGDWHSLGLRADGSVEVWGSNDWGEGSAPVPNTDFVAVAAGDWHNLGLKRDGSVVGWGRNFEGQCTVPEPNTQFVAVAASLSHSLGLKEDGSIVGWGRADYGQCDVPVPNSGFVAVATETWYSLGLKADGSIVVWGNVGNNLTAVPEPNTGFVSVAAGFDHILGLKFDGTIVAWGNNNHGQCNVPEPNMGFVGIAAGFQNSLGLRADGSVVVWGDDGNRQRPRLPVPNSGFVSIAAGLYGFLGLKGDTQARTATALALGERMAGSALPLCFADYRLDLETGQARHLLVRVHAAPGDGTWYMGGRYGLLPSFGQQNWLGTPSSEPGVLEMLIPSPAAGTYYFSVYPQFAAGVSTPFEIEVLPVERHLSRLTTTRGGNGGTMTFQAQGLGFEPGVRLELRDGATVLRGAEPVEICLESLAAQLDLSGIPPGVYDVVVVWPSGAEERLADAFEVVPGIGPRFEARVTGPSEVRAGRGYTALIEYENTGDSDLVPPLLFFSNSRGIKMIAPGTGRVSHTSLALLAVGRDKPAGLLRPGAKNQIAVSFVAPAPGECRFELRAVLPSNEAVDWGGLEPLVRPCCVADAEWETYWAQVKSGMGSTWVELLGNLSSVLTRGVQNTGYAEASRLFDFGNVLCNASGEIMSLSPISPEPGAGWDPESDVTVTPVGTFDSARTRTFVVTHGWNSGADSPLIAVLSEALAGCGDSNVFLLDWREGASGTAWGAASRATNVGVAAAAKLRAYVNAHGGGQGFWETVTYIGCEEGNAVNKTMSEAEGSVGKGLILDPAYRWGGESPSFRSAFQESLSIGSIELGDANPCNPLVNGDIAEAQYLLTGVVPTAEDPGLHEAALRALVSRLQETGGCNDAWLNMDLPKTRDGAMGLDGTVLPAGGPVDGYIACPLEAPLGSLGDYVDDVVITLVRPVDPNEKTGPAGTGSPETERFVQPGDELPYVVYFENKCSASVPAQEVVVTDYLDADLDWSTFRLTEIVWGTDHRVAVPPDTASFYVRETVPDHRPGVDKTWWVDVYVDVDYTTGLVQWRFRTLDPDTGELPEDVHAGFLPPNAIDGVCAPADVQGPGEAHVAYTVKAKNGLAPGTRITNTATIVFDTEAPIVTNEVFNTIQPPPVNVPDLVGMSYAEAEAALMAVGLAMGPFSWGYNSTIPLYGVIAQDPASGTLPVGGLVCVVVSAGPEPVSLPNVVGMTRVEAEAAIMAAKLMVGEVREEYHASVAAGVVLGQDPAPGTVFVDSAVNLVVSKGPEPVPVPNVVGMLLSNAQGAIAAARLVVGTVSEQYSPTVPAGTVVRQEPASGTLLPGEAVDLVVSKGPQPVAVPNVVGMSEGGARAAILAAGLSVGTVSEQYSASVAASVVMAQDPAAGTLLPGAAVNLVVSKGPQPVAVPNVVGMAQTEARAAIEAAGLVVGSVSEQYSPAGIGVVIGQEPASGTLLPGGAVGLVVSKGPQPVQVPNVVGLSRADALAAIAAAGLGVGNVRERYSETGPVDVVLEQDPASGTVPKGATVALVVSNRKRGDLDRSGAVNATDVQLVINAALGRSGDPGSADVDEDGRVNAADVQMVINSVLGRN